LLLYPNPADPLNAEAAAFHLKNEQKYKEKVLLVDNELLILLGERVH
jgi:ubiquitin-protein ligase